MLNILKVVGVMVLWLLSTIGLVELAEFIINEISKQGGS